MGRVIIISPTPKNIQLAQIVLVKDGRPVCEWEYAHRINCNQGTAQPVTDFEWPLFQRAARNGRGRT